MMKLRSALALGAMLMAASASAQVANVATIAASSFSGYNATANVTAALSTTAFSNDGATLLVVKGGGASSTATVTSFATQMFQNGYGVTPLTNLVVTIPAAAYMVLGPFPQGRYNSPQGTVVVNFSNISGLTVAPISVAQ